MEQNGIYLKTSFSNFNPNDITKLTRQVTDEQPHYVGPHLVTSLYLEQFKSLPMGSSEVIYLENVDSTWFLGFAGIPTFGVMLRLLAIMENDVFPTIGCDLQVSFNYQKDDQIGMNGVNPHYIPNANTYTDILQFVERCQHHVY